jgi:hypothetical protein
MLFCDTIFFAPQPVRLYSVRAMNKRSVKKRPVKASRNQVARKAAARRISGKSVAMKTVQAMKPVRAMKSVQSPTPIENPIHVSTVPAAKPIAMPGPALRTHKFRVGEAVLYTSSPITRPGASGTYKVVKLLPSDGDDYQYRIKNSGEAFERVAKESQLETEH